MQSILEAMAGGMFVNALTATTTATECAARPMEITIESLTEIFNKAQSIEAERERAFNAAAIKAGFDLDRGDRMIVGSGFDLSLVPPRYRGLVKPSDILTPGTTYFIAREIADPLSLDLMTWRF